MTKVALLIKQESVRRLREGRDRIVKCLGLMNESQVWHRPNEHVVSVGNLVLHLSGNVGQWVNATLGNSKDTRDRDSEFEQRVGFGKNDLINRISDVVERAEHVIDTMDEHDLERTWTVQGFEETGVAILLHVVEHFSYHTGQITLHTKTLLNIDTGYYAGQDLNAKQ